MRLLAVLAWLPTVAVATTARMASLEELTQLADLIVVGEVTARESAWRGTRIMTDHRVTIGELWKGEHDQPTLSITTLGGVVEDIGQHVAGEPALPTGIRAVFFLARDGNAYCTVGMWQGAFLMTGGGDSLLMRPDNGVHIVGPRPSVPLQLAELRTSVVEILRAR